MKDLNNKSSTTAREILCTSCGRPIRTGESFFYVNTPAKANAPVHAECLEKATK